MVKKWPRHLDRLGTSCYLCHWSHKVCVTNGDAGHAGHIFRTGWDRPTSDCGGVLKAYIEMVGKRVHSPLPLLGPKTYVLAGYVWPHRQTSLYMPSQYTVMAFFYYMGPGCLEIFTKYCNQASCPKQSKSVTKSIWLLKCILYLIENVGF